MFSKNSPLSKIVLILIFIGIILYNSSQHLEPFSSFVPDPVIDNYTYTTKRSLGEIFKRSDMNLDSYPNVEIKPGQLLFQDNKFLPECCYYNGEYSTDKGCPCITPEQQDYLRKRGKNAKNGKVGSFVREAKALLFSPTIAFKQGKQYDDTPIYRADVPELQVAEKNAFNKFLNLGLF